MRNITILFFLGVMIALPALIIAAGMGPPTTPMGGGPPMGPPCGGPFPPCPVPLDGGTIFLALAGAAFGIKKIFKNTQTPD
ncbi:MAG: PID-CTERM protein-sorting domain-containing protein [Flavobacteriales bacterium]